MDMPSYLSAISGNTPLPLTDLAIPQVLPLTRGAAPPETTSHSYQLPANQPTAWTVNVQASQSLDFSEIFTTITSVLCAPKDLCVTGKTVWYKKHASGKPQKSSWLLFKIKLRDTGRDHSSALN